MRVAAHLVLDSVMGLAPGGQQIHHDLASFFWITGDSQHKSIPVKHSQRVTL